MAPNIAHAAGHNQQPARRQLSRIVPAIPHRLSRAAPAPRPVTPEDSNKSTPKHEHERGPHQDATEEQSVGGADHEAPLRAEEAPMTPDSRASVTDKDEAHTSGLSGSPTKPTLNPVQHSIGSLGWTAPNPVRTFDGASLDPAAEYEQTDHSNGPPVALPGPNGPGVDFVTNGVNRKLAVPTELPPPFYPANKMNNHTLPAQENGYRHEPLAPPVTNTIPHATGEQNSAATPNGSAHHPPPHPPPGFLPEFIPSQNPSQMLHHTEAGDSWPRFAQTLPISEPPQLPTMGLPQLPTMGLDAIRNGTSAIQLNGHGLQNGSDSSHSHSPVKTQTFEQPREGSDQGDDKQTMPYHQNRVSLQTNPLMESPLELASYLSRQFGKMDFADYVLQVRFQSSVLISMPVHGIIVARSPVIAEAISRSSSDLHRSRDTRPVLEVTTTDSFVSRESVEEAVRVLYGAPLLSAQTFLFGLARPTNGSSQSPHDGAPQRMRELLNYIAAGRFFQMPIMQHCGVEIVRMLLRPDTVEQVLHFGLRPSGSSRASKNDLEFKDPFTSALLNYAIDFIACTFPRDFKLFSVAPELQDAPRLPPSLDVRPPTHHPRLSQIRFGEAPPEDDKQPSSTSRMFSSILLSLPLGLLDRLFNHPALAGQIGWSEVIRILREIIDERERRRKKWISGQVKPLQSCTTDSHLMNVLRTEERLETVEPTTLHPSGYRLLALWADERT